MSEARFPRPLAWVAGRRWGTWLTARFYAPVDRLLYRLTGGRRGLSPRRSVLLLTTTGRRSGEQRQVPVLYLRDGRDLWVMASNYGRPRHPAWSSNLLAHPEARVTVGGEERDVRARLASRDEKSALWPRLLRLYPAWKSYSGWTDRDFRLFCLEPQD